MLLLYYCIYFVYFSSSRNTPGPGKLFFPIMQSGMNDCVCVFSISAPANVFPGRVVVNPLIEFINYKIVDANKDERWRGKESLCVSGSFLFMWETLQCIRWPQTVSCFTVWVRERPAELPLAASVSPVNIFCFLPFICSSCTVNLLPPRATVGEIGVNKNHYTEAFWLSRHIFSLSTLNLWLCMLWFLGSHGAVCKCGMEQNDSDMNVRLLTLNKWQNKTRTNDWFTLNRICLPPIFSQTWSSIINLLRHLNFRGVMKLHNVHWCIYSWRRAVQDRAQVSLFTLNLWSFLFRPLKIIFLRCHINEDKAARRCSVFSSMPSGWFYFSPNSHGLFKDNSGQS